MGKEPKRTIGTDGQVELEPSHTSPSNSDATASDFSTIGTDEQVELKPNRVIPWGTGGIRFLNGTAFDYEIVGTEPRKLITLHADEHNALVDLENSCTQQGTISSSEYEIEYQRAVSVCAEIFNRWKTRVFEQA